MSVETVDHVHEHEHEHKETFITKYIFSQDHKTIAKQYLISGIFWAMIGGFMSLIFRLQLGFPEMDLGFLRPILAGTGDNAWYYHGIFRAYGRIEWYFQ